jgi:hypothetical protein
VEEINQIALGVLNACIAVSISQSFDPMMRCRSRMMFPHYRFIIRRLTGDSWDNGTAPEE